MAITVDYEELAGSRRERLSDDGVQVERQLICNWEDRITLAREALGYWDSLNYIWNGYITYPVYYPPDKYEPDGNTPLFHVYAYDVMIEPYPTPPTTAGLSYNKAKVTIYYKTQDYQQIGDNEIYITESIEPCSEFLTLDKRGLYFGTGATAVRLEDANIEVPTMISRMIDWVYTIHRVPSLTYHDFDIQGKVNANPVYSRALDITFPAETLLSGNPSAYRQIAKTGDFHWTVTHRFTYKNNGTIADPKGWNHWPRTDSASSTGIVWERITNGTENIPIYRATDWQGTGVIL
jgi:hypothetical protein